MTRFLKIFCLVVGLAVAATQTSAAAKSFSLSSPAFKNGAMIPQRFSYRGYGCSGENVSPALRWSGAPSGTKSFALTVFDPDAPGKGWWHWVAYDISPKLNGLAENGGGIAAGSPVSHASEAMTSFGKPGYGGPCPPVGDKPHHYMFTLYALDVANLPGATSKTTGPDLVALLKGHVLGKTQLLGRFAR